MNAFRGRRVVMTGGGGFIGSHLVDRLARGGAEVILIGRDTGRSTVTAEHVAAGRARFVQTSFAPDEQAQLRDLFRPDDLLVLLGYTQPPATNPAGRLLEEFATNVDPNIRLLDAARDLVAHVAFASCVAVYGFPTTNPVTESAPLAPVTPYAVAKTALELAVRSSASYRGVPAAILRFATVYGPGETAPRLIPNLIRGALDGVDLHVGADAFDTTDYVHVDDAVEATVRAIALRAEGVFNIGSGVGTSIVSLAQLIVELTGAQVGLSQEQRGPADAPKALVCDTSHATAELGFRARHEIASGLAGEIDWFRAERQAPLGEIAINPAQA